MDEHQKIYLLKNNDSSEFMITRMIDFSHLDILREIKALRRIDWVRLHMSERALTLGNRTYNFANSLSLEVKVPNTYFGQEIEVDRKESENNQGDAWKIDNINSMTSTTSIIAQCYN